MDALIEAQIDVLSANGRTFDQMLHESSRESDLILIGMAAPGNDYVSYYEPLRDRTEGLPSTVFVLAACESRPV